MFDDGISKEQNQTAEHSNTNVEKIKLITLSKDSYINIISYFG